MRGCALPGDHISSSSSSSSCAVLCCAVLCCAVLCDVVLCCCVVLCCVVLCCVFCRVVLCCLVCCRVVLWLCVLMCCVVLRCDYTTRHNTPECNTTRHDTTQHETAQNDATQHSTAQHNTTQHNTSQNNATQDDKAWAHSFPGKSLASPFSWLSNHLLVHSVDIGTPLSPSSSPSYPFAVGRQVWNHRERRLCYSFVESEDHGLTSLIVNGPGTFLGSGDEQGVVTVYDLSAVPNDCWLVRPEMVKRHVRFRAHESPISALAFIEKNHCILTGGADGICKTFTLAGVNVGVFGQTPEWDMTKPDTFLKKQLPMDDDYGLSPEKVWGLYSWLSGHQRTAIQWSWN